ncbi:MAG: hypothetical protein HFI69_04810 [Lachnospiraceae bacterium]|nr:hypothetical protein [Lachnospiraceae bacterium]
MTYELFKHQLVENLRTFFSADTQISIQQFPHNNHLILDGLTILEPGINISPTIYLNHYFEQYCSHTDFSVIQKQILQYYHKHCPPDSIDTTFFTCFDQVSPRIVYKLIHFEKNRELLQEIPHFPYLDLAIVFYCLVPESPYENASILIYNHHLAYWNITKETLLQLAGKNTPALLPFLYSSLAEVIFPSINLFPICGQEVTQEVLEEESVPMYVLTNSQQYFGAACILYPNALQEISENLKDNLYILPSSIHEVILVPASLAENPVELSQIVREVNLTEVAPEEILSDSVYYYQREENQVLLAQI